MASESKTTQDLDEIRRWAEERGGKPSHVVSTSVGEDVGILRIDFPGYSGEHTLEPISWDQWFQKFVERGLALIYQDQTAEGEKSNFNKIVNAETAEEHDEPAAPVARKRPAKKTAAKKSAAQKSSSASAAPKKAVPVKSAGKKDAPKKAAAKKSAAKKTVAKKSAVKKTAAKKAVKKAAIPKRAAKTVVKKAVKKSPAKKAVARKALAKKSASRRRY